MQSDRLVWVDVETTGLDPVADHLLEVAMVLTDGDLEIIDIAPTQIIHQPESVLAPVDDWIALTHGASGLLDEVRLSTTSLADAGNALLSWLERIAPPGHLTMCGSSVHFDRAVLLQHMPMVECWFHHRQVDVSSINILQRLWYPTAAPPAKQRRHRALGDIRESIAELRDYRERIFGQTPTAC